MFGTLFLFKYLDFAFSLAERVLDAAGLSFSSPALDLILPAGISFYLFMAAGYLIDVYRGGRAAEHSFLLCALFLSFFPHVISGPIARAGGLIPQFREVHRFDYDKFRAGLLRFLWGAFKKLCIADRLAVLVNAVTGESQYYEEVPSWVDRVYASDLIMQQYDYYGLYQNGFLNSIFGQRDVTQTTEGYNYIAINDDVYMYTGVTSVTSDQSNIGFLLSNQRTKETFFYPVAGATEASAQASAQSQVQQMRYVATFPLLLNIADQPTYFMSLKGDDGLVKMYAMVNVQQYQIVETGQTVADCEANYRRALAENGLIAGGEAEVPDAEHSEVSGVLAEIRTAVMDGNSYYFLRLEGGDVFYAISAADSPVAVILNVGDEVSITYAPGEEGSILSGTSVERTAGASPALPAGEGETGGEAPRQEEAAQPQAAPAA